MKGKVLVVAEHKEGELDNITWELLGKGRTLADQMESSLGVLLTGSDIDALAESLKSSGADVVLLAQDAGLKNYNAELYTTVMSRAIKEFDPSVILMGYTYLGMETGPAVSVRLGGSMVTNCTALEIDEGKLTAVRPVFGGTLLARVDVEGPQPYTFSFQKGVLPKPAPSSREGEIQRLTLGIDGVKLRSKVIEILTAAKGKIDITKAKILVSIGRGIGSEDKIPVFQELADALGGELSCSRPVADMGWLPPSHQVGISANTVTPDIYIACGISGASQHVTAMRDSGVVIAINKDPNAPIFRVADYGIAADLFDVVPHLLEGAKEKILS